jgi:hypothetical protein
MQIKNAFLVACIAGKEASSCCEFVWSLSHHYVPFLPSPSPSPSHRFPFLSLQAKGIEHLALRDNDGTWTRPAHVFIGLFALAGVFIQAAAGLYKYVVATRDRTRVMRWHTALGPAVWMCGLICIGLAAWFEYLEGAGHWSIGQVAAIWIGVAAVLGSVLAHIKYGTRDHVTSASAGGADEYFIKRTGLLRVQ